MRQFKFILVAFGFAASSSMAASVLHMPPGQKSLQLVPVGNLGNGLDVRSPANLGAVSYAYSIGQFEITNAQYMVFLNAVAKTDTYALYNPAMAPYGISRSGSSGSYFYFLTDSDSSFLNRPVRYVNFWDCCRFANWLERGQPEGLQTDGTTEDGSYPLHGYVGGDASWLTRNPGAKWFLTSASEWHKAAFHKNDGVTANYWLYATRSESAPNNNAPPQDTGNSVNFYFNKHHAIGPPYFTTEVGAYASSFSAYGTYDQDGNIWEWDENRAQRGGGWNSNQYGTLNTLQADYYTSFEPPTSENDAMGFRIVRVGQLVDCNGNGIPDEYEPDDDQDGIINACDNCPYFNPDQQDSDEDGFGDMCEVARLRHGHTYFMLPNSNWTVAEASAVQIGGHLATVNDAAENGWIWSNFGMPTIALWHGLHDNTPTREFQWISGEPVGYTNWAPGEPNNGTSTLNYGHMWAPNAGCSQPAGVWTDAFDLPQTSPGGCAPADPTLFYGVAEIVDCNQNMIADAVDISTGTSHDCNENDIPDECEIVPSLPPSAGRVLWLRADQGVITDSAGRVSQWSDQSGHGHHYLQNLEAARPVRIDGPTSILHRSVLHFDGVDDSLSTADSLVPGNQFTVITVMSRLNGSYPWSVGPVNENVFYEGFPHGGVPNSNTVDIGHGNGNDARATLAGIGDSNWKVMSVIGDGQISQTKVYVNGAAAQVALAPGANDLEWDIQPGGFLGRLDPFFTSADFAEFMVYDRPLSATERTQAEQYLLQKYFGAGTTNDCNHNEIPDACELPGHDCNNNGVLDECDVAGAGTVVYSTNFESGASSEWSNLTTSITPSGGRRFLGEFDNGTVSLSLQNLPPHSEVWVSFDLYSIRSWDGNSTQHGPDIWKLSVAGGPSLLQTTFSNSRPSCFPQVYNQAYPDEYPGGNHQWNTGASEVDTLGYSFDGCPNDAVYRIFKAFAHTGASLSIQFNAQGIGGGGDETWGIDDVVVRISGSPDCNDDGTPDDCEPDTDQDEIIDACDNCANAANPDQADCDHDAIGDVCDDDRDGDGVPDIVDVCPDTPGCDSMPDGRPRLDLNEDCTEDGLDIQLIVDRLLNGCRHCP